MIIHIHPAIFGIFDVKLWKLKRMRDKGLFDVKVEKYIEKIKKIYVFVYKGFIENVN